MQADSLDATRRCLVGHPPSESLPVHPSRKLQWPACRCLPATGLLDHFEILVSVPLPSWWVRISDAGLGLPPGDYSSDKVRTAQDTHNNERVQRSRFTDCRCFFSIPLFRTAVALILAIYFERLPLDLLWLLCTVCRSIRKGGERECGSMGDSLKSSMGPSVCRK